MGKILVCALLLASTGCVHSMGPVVARVSLKDGELRYTRCNLVVGSWFSLGWYLPVEYDDCVDQAGKSVDPPDPLRSKP